SEIIKWVLALAGGIVTITAAITAITKAFAPYKTLTKSVARHADLLDKDNKRIAECEAAFVHMCRSQLALLDHELTGNSIDRLRAAKDELQRYLTER
ncbi:hypothetical protein LJC33_06620, partial [Eubacteriales bacterium OttesenSCG-928-N13]|nr:hypothetical protein [Eubacteriales bacterium OttesenSCG-928-N13]